jgi:type I restriction enzyme R subunit
MFQIGVLEKWIRENITDSRVLIITDREELDSQIENFFLGVDEQIYRTKSGKDLIGQLNDAKPWLICSLIHKFGRNNPLAEEKGIEDYIEDIKNNLPANFLCFR